MAPLLVDSQWIGYLDRQPHERVQDWQRRRLARLIDPFGHHWEIASRVEDLTPAEIEARGQAAFSAGAPIADA